MFERKLYKKMLEWKEQSQGKTALLVEGARRVGKSTLVKEFAAREYKSFIFIDFSVAPKEVKGLFEDISDLNFLFLQLQARYGVDLYPRDSVIVFDEVQLCPLARQAIKALVADARYDYIETGSLISIRKNVKDILIPSEETKLKLFPMDFEEFMLAVGKGASVNLLKKFYEQKLPLGAAHSSMLRDFRLYMLVGGMPQAVVEYVESNNFRRVDVVKRGILELYNDDFMKIDPTGKLSKLFNAIPAELNRNASRYQVSSVLHGANADSLLEQFAQMQDSATVLFSYNANDLNVGLPAAFDLRKFKLFMCDTGLFVTQMFKDKDSTENDLYLKLLSDKLATNLGYLYENVVAQTLAAKGDKLFYHVMKIAESHFYEIDFLLARGNKLCPLEVKSSNRLQHKSLDVFAQKYSSRIASQYLLYTKDLQKQQNVCCLPIYMTHLL